MAKATSWKFTDAEARKLGERKGLETPVVLAVNYARLILEYPRLCRGWGSELTHEAGRLGSTVARLKLKGIDGRAHNQGSMWFNSTRSEGPYPGLTSRRLVLWKHGMIYENGWRDRCCMAVVSSFREEYP